ncbi:MAG: SDR family NAD(P)-dependent oxidoreductase, partial [Verrucomicrobiales bacterium]
MEEARFADQVAIVTGGADGIGKAITRRLAEEGARVTIFDVSVANAEATAGELAEAGLRVGVEIVDIADENAV